MPSSVYPDELAKILLKQCPKAGLIERVWPRLQTLIKRAYGDVYPLKHASALDPEQVRKAIADGLQTKVDKVRFVSLSSKDALQGLDIEEMINHVPRSLTTNRQDAFRALAEFDKDSRFYDGYFKELGHPLTEAVIMGNMRAFSGGGDLSTMMIVSTTPGRALFFLLGHLFAGEEADVDAMLPFIELLPHAIPVGEQIEDLGTWVVLVR
jgi:hypothetical protein